MYIISSKPEITGDDRTIATGSNGYVYIENGELHAADDTRHLVYKPAAERAGWHRITDEKDYYLGAGCSPTLNLEDVEVADEELWAAIATTPEQKMQKDKSSGADEE